jgi:hypothetical protein
MTKTLSMGPSRLWYDSVDPGVSETNIDVFNWWLNTSSNATFLCLDNTIGSQVWQQRVGNGQSASFSNLAFTQGLFTGYTVPGAYPYAVLSTDYIVLVDTGSARTINLMASPINGQQLIIKDTVGSAGSNNITISGNGKNIDGSGSKSISTNYGSTTLMYNGTQWGAI